ncbi:MAG: hypothetical protein M3Z38_05160 [Bombilactobacillus mellifer]|nr:hypothetical protein [Bombilactobacillus mellifer]
MLKKYVPEFKKIAMGILTYNDRRIKTSKLENTINQLTNRENEVYLWRGPDRNYDGLLSLEIMDKNLVIVKDIILRHNFQNKVGYNLVLNDLQRLMSQKKFLGAEKLKDIFKEWEKTLPKNKQTI